MVSECVPQCPFAALIVLPAPVHAQWIHGRRYARPRTGFQTMAALEAME